MIKTVYSIVLAYFSIGAVLLLYITKNKDSDSRRANWIKYITYFIIVNIILLTIFYYPRIFPFLAFIIISRSSYELSSLQKNGECKTGKFFTLSLFVFAVLAFGFLYYSMLDANILLYIYFIITVSDAFSQLTGQLAGRTKAFPSISPNKTLEGVIGGIAASVITSLMIREALQFSHLTAAFAGVLISVSALSGDLAASYYKRYYNVKDFPLILPGHGGFLDRFDSFIAAGAFAGFYYLIQGQLLSISIK